MNKQKITVTVFSLLIGAGHSSTLINGSLSGSPALNSFNSLVPAGWTSTTGSVDTIDPSFNFIQIRFSASSDGGTFVEGQGRTNVAGTALDQTEGMSQTIAGLIVGGDYEINFEQAISNVDATMIGPGSWNVTFGGVTQTSSIMALPALGTPSGWIQQSLLFKATSTTETIFFDPMPQLGVGEIVNVMGIDGISIRQVPEPSTSLMSLLASVSLLTFRRREH